MSVPAGLQSLSVSGRDIKNNNNKSHVLFHPSTGDANANQLVLIGETPDDQASSPLPPLVAQSEAQDKLLIWGREERCLDHDIQELELLECREIHTFHGDGGEGVDGKRLGEVEEDDEGEDSKRGADEGLSISSSSTASCVSVHGNDNDSNGRDRGMDRQKEVAGEREVLHQDLNYSVPRSGKETGGGGGGGEQNSGGDRGSLCVSAVSTLSNSLDPTGHPLTSNPNPTTSAKRRASPVGLNSTAAPHSQDTPNLGELQYPRSPDQEVHHQYQETSNLEVELSRGQSATEEGSKLDVTTQRQDVRCYQGNIILSSSDGGIGQRKKGVGAPPPRRQQLVRPLCQLEPGRGRSLAEPITRRRSSTSPSLSPDAGRKVVDPGHHGVDGKQTQETLEVKSSMVNCSSYSHLHSHPHYQPSSSPGATQPSQASQSAQREARSLDRRRSSAERTPSLEKRHQYQDQSQLRYRRTNRCGATVTSQPRSHTPPRSPLGTPQGSPRKQDHQQQQQPMSPSRIITGSARYPQGYGSSGLRPPLKSNLASTGIPIPPLHQQAPNPSPSPPKPKGVRPKIITYIRKGPQLKPQASDGPYQVSSLPSRLSAYTHTHSPATNMPQKHSSSPKTHTNTHSRGIASRNTPVLSASNLLYDKYRQEMQKNRLFNSGMMGTGIRGYTHTVPPTHTQSGSHTHTHTGSHTHSHTAPPKLGSKAESFYGPLVDNYQPAEMSRNAGSLGREDPSGPRMATQAAQPGGSGSLLRSGIGLRPQLGLGAAARATPGSVVFTASKNQMMVQGQRTALGFSQPVQAVSPATNQNGQDNTGDQQRPSPTPAPSQTPRTLLPSQSALRAPGFSSVCLPSGAPGAGRLAAFGFIRSSSVSSVSSLHSVESSPSDPCRRPSVCVDPPLYRVTNPPCTDPQRGGGPPNYATRNLQPPSTPALPRRYLPAQPRGSPVGVRKEFPRSSEITRSLPSSPKRLAVVPPKPQSPVLPRQRPAAAARGSVPPCSPRRVPPFRPKQEPQENLQREKEEAQLKEREREEQEREREREKQREEVQRLQNRCVEQEDQLTSLREELRKTTLGLQAFIITSQHYCLQNESATEKEKELSLEIQRIKQEVASNTTQWERLQKEKAELEVGFERELAELQLQQEEELAAVEAELRVCHSKETEHLRAEHQEEVEEIRTQQQEQMDELMVNHEAAIQELRDMHNITMTTLYEEHARTMRDLRKAHEQQKVTLEEDFEKLRLSLQDQVDTLLFQKSSLRDKAKRFEEALRRSTDEHIVDTLAPYQHIEEDLKSLKDVVEMKNNQIHQQEKKISDLERVAQKNVVLEERMQVLQQQNEDLMARIDNNLALSRQLSEENANLQENVEKENGEKKRLSRNNEELLWRLQTSPLCSPCSSPIHRSFSTSPTPSSCFFSSSPGMGGGTGFDAPSHYCGGYLPPAPTHGYSPSHRENQNQSPGPATPTHRGFSNQNQSPGPATPTHRGFSNQNQSPGPATPTHRVSPNHCHSPARLNPLMR